MSKQVVQSIVTKSYSGDAQELERVEYTNKFYLQSINCLIILCFMAAAALSGGFSNGIMHQVGRSIDHDS